MTVMTPRKPRLQKVTVSLLKEDLTRADALQERDDLVGYVLPELEPEQNSLFTIAKRPTPPRWTDYLKSHVAGDLGTLLTASASAILLLESADRLFAVTFGQGRHLLERDAVVQDFGLKVVLNTVAPDQLKSVDAKTIDETTVHTRRDVSRDSALNAFGLDISRDLLRAVTGTPRDETLAHRLTGSDALGIHTRAQVPDLPALAARLLEAYSDDAYRENFDFVDFMRQEKRPEVLDRLNNKLIEALRSREIGDVHLAAPETLDWLDIDGFHFSTSKSGETDNDPRISSYLKSVEGNDLDVRRLKGDRLLAIRASDEELHRWWPIYECLVYQAEVDDSLYVLSTGDWFRVDLDYRDRVDAAVNALPRVSGLPDADPGTDEATYNAKAAGALDALCLDQKLVYDSGRDKMEICDILTREGQLIHVKNRGSSSTLSHLFAQGTNSAERLLLDQEFRAKARAVAGAEDASFAEVLTAARPAAADHEISFVVITRSDRNTPLTLPFFSVVSLRQAAERLELHGFRVSVAAVRELP